MCLFERERFSGGAGGILEKENPLHCPAKILDNQFGTFFLFYEL